MIPESTSDIDIQQIEYANYSTKTYKLDIRNKRIIGMTDGLEAYKIAAEKTLRTTRYAHPIYDGDYGWGVEKNIGKDFDFVKSSCEREIYEALSVDDRFQGIENFIITQTGLDHCIIKFNIISTEGTVSMELEV